MPAGKSDTPHTLTLGFSPCPNDTFMFDALVNGKIETEGLTFNVVMEDVETLNRMALHEELDVTKLSFAAFTQVTDRYQLLDSGSALGNGIGPLVISKNEFAAERNAFRQKTVAIPGMHTTANFLFGIFFPETLRKEEMVFSEIEEAVLNGSVDAGVIIHENRFTYQQKGLKKITDLGERWEEETGQPVPLGGIVIRKSLPFELKFKIDRLIRESVEFAMSRPQSSEEYVKCHAQEMESEVRRQHIEAYVNGFSVHQGLEGRGAVRTFFSKAREAGIIQKIPDDIFISPDFYMKTWECEF